MANDGKRKGKLDIPELKDANLAGTANSGDCTLILTVGYCAEAFAVSCLACSLIVTYLDTCIHINTLLIQCLLLFADGWIICCGPRLLWCVSFAGRR